MLPLVETAHSSNVMFHGGTFNSAQGDLHIHNIHNKDSESGLHILRLGVSLGAMHDSAERYPSPNCHPDTRKAVRQIILDWIQNESLESFFFWLYGPAGAGKTAILQAISELLCSPSGSDLNFGGSFFFSRGKQGRDQGRFLFSTIAYQLALNVPGLRQHLNRIMELNPTLHTKSMDVQIRTLIIDAFKCLSPLPKRSYLVIVDGLDECHDKATQQLILRLLCETITVHKLPFRFLVGSRPESHIRASFDQESLYTITHRVVLDETFNPGRDIRVLLRDGFAKICAESSILAHVEQPWPREGVIDLLVQRSSGQFIYAATVLKFVGADFCSPTKQLALVLKPDATAFSDLDHLYTQILSVYPSAVNIVQVLGIFIAFEKNPTHFKLPEVIEDILGMEEGEQTSVTCRSGPFHVNRQEYENQVTIRSFALILQSIQFWRRSSITRVLHTATWKYFTKHLLDHFVHSPKVVKEAIMTDINDLVQEFWRTTADEVNGECIFAMRCLHKILQQYSNILEEPDSWWSYTKLKPDLDDQIIIVELKVLRDGYRKMLDQSLSKSKDLGDILRLLPGVVVQYELSMQGMADLYRIEPDLLDRLIKSPIEALVYNAYKSSNTYYKLDGYLSRFLQDRDRSQLYYCDPILHHISICRQFLSLLNRDGGCREPYELANYASSHFYDHLCAATTDFLNPQNISDDHPAVEFLCDLEATIDCVDRDLLGEKIHLARYSFMHILKWADRLNCRLKSVAVSVSNVDLTGRVCDLMNKMKREVIRMNGPSQNQRYTSTVTRRLPKHMLQTMHPRHMSFRGGKM